MKPMQSSSIVEPKFECSYIPGTNRLTDASVHLLLEQVRQNDEILKKLLQVDLNIDSVRQKK